MIKSNPYNDPSSRYPRIEDMVDVINKMTVTQMRDATEISKIPLHARQSLMVFLRDWRLEDPSHERFMKFIPTGFPQQEALMMADLLSFAMVEGEERKKTGKDRYIVWKRWQDELQPFYKKLPKDLSITDLVGIHCTLLNMLPQKNYSQYTITQLFAEDETMLSSLVGEKIKISPLEFEALTMLTRMVEKGAIDQFKLAMTKGSTGSLIEMARRKGVDIGSMVLDAFKIAQQAAQYFQTGDFKMAVDKMDMLYSNYEVGANSFAEGLNQMFVATMSAINSVSDNSIKLKGISSPVLMSLDLSFAPQGFPAGIGFKPEPVKVSNRVREAASARAKSNQAGKDGPKGKYTGTPGSAGTYGLRAVAAKAPGNQEPVITTDWYALFAAFVADTGKFDDGQQYDKIFGSSSNNRPILRFVVHGFLEEGMTDLLPKGLLTVAIQDMGNKSDKGNGAVFGFGKSLIPKIEVDLVFQDFDPEGAKEFRKTIPTIREMVGETDSDLQSTFEDLDIGVDARRRGRKKSSKKRVTQGQLIAIDLTPSTQVRLSKAVDRADYFKQLNKEDSDFKALWNKYGRGNKPLKKKGVWHWRGKTYEQTKADKAKDPSNKKPPTSLRNAIAKEGTYADYKSGMSNMRLIYAPRKDNGNMVPFRLVMPKIMVRQEGDRLVAKSGSADTKKVKKLLDRLEADFGTLKFKLKPLAVGGYDRYRSFKKAGDKQDPVTRVDRGVFKIFQAQGLETGSDRFSTNAHPSGVRPNGNIIYSAMTRSGQPVDMEVR